MLNCVSYSKETSWGRGLADKREGKEQREDSETMEGERDRGKERS